MSYFIQEEIFHHGIKGMHWGIRRYQNPDGTYTALGKQRRRYSDLSDEEKTKAKKYVATAAIATATVATAALLVHNNPEAIGKVIKSFSGKKMKDITSNSIKIGKQHVSTIMKKGLSIGKKTLKSTGRSIINGTKESIKEAPKKAIKTVITGGTLLGTKYLLDKTVGKEMSTQIFQANDNKKIGKFWKVSPDDRDDEDK